MGHGAALAGVTLRRRFSRVVGSRGEAARPGPPVPSAATPGARQAVSSNRMKRAKPPNTRGRGPLLASPGFGVLVVCIVKDEAAYLEEWLAYHVGLGVDHFAIYDNGSTDDSAELLARYQNHGLVTRIDWPMEGGQLAAYNHALRFFGGVTDWLAYFDVDEFVVPLQDDDIPSLLARFDDAAVVRVPRLDFGYSGHRQPPGGLTIDAYTQVANVLDLDADLPPRVKSIVRPEAISAVDIHLAFPADVPPPGVPTATAEESVRKVAQLNHYYTRSFEEFESKRFRGSATGRIERPAVPFDLATVATDSAARRFSQRTQDTLARLRGLERRPYAYGSELRLSWFPRPNDLGRFAEFAIANLAAGLLEPARSAALRLRNLHPGIGLVADLASTGFTAHAAGFSGSAHGEVLIEHMRGRLESSLSRADRDRPVRATTGTLTRLADGSATLAPVAGSGGLVMALPAGEMRRCWALGFLLACESPLRLGIAVDRDDGSSGEPVRLELPASPCLAGIVEVEPLPQHAARMRVTVETAAERVDMHDLFAVSYG